MADNSFKLKSIKDINRGIFAPTDPDAKRKDSAVWSLPIGQLHPFKNHPFKAT